MSYILLIFSEYGLDCKTKASILQFLDKDCLLLCKEWMSRLDKIFVVTGQKRLCFNIRLSTKRWGDHIFSYWWLEMEVT